MSKRNAHRRRYRRRRSRASQTPQIASTSLSSSPTQCETPSAPGTEDDTLSHTTRPHLVAVLEIDHLEQRLFDPQRGEEFIVYARQPIVIKAGSVVAILGPSGCGKTTLLTVLGLLRRPSNLESLGRFIMRVRGSDMGIKEYDLRSLWTERRHSQIEYLRRSAVGFALQTGELLPALTVRENIAAPLRMNGVSGRLCWQRVDELLNAFGLSKTTESSSKGSKIAHSRINKLSGGEYQRVALARAISHRPTLVFVDEPTASLNRELARGALEQLRGMQSRDHGCGATIMITHDEQLADDFATLVIRMEPLKGRPAGEVVEIIERPRDTSDSGSGSAGGQAIPLLSAETNLAMNGRRMS